MPTTTRIARTVALALALAAVVAPSASARAADTHRVRELATAAPTSADMVARREALATKAWLEANPPKIVEVSPDDGGLDILSASIGAALGAAVPLTLILIEVAGTWVVRRRRDPARARLA